MLTSMSEILQCGRQIMVNSTDLCGERGSGYPLKGACYHIKVRLQGSI